MQYVITTKDPTTINMSPKNEAEEVLQNIRTILATAKGTVPLDREFGLDNTVIDLPTSLGKAKLTNEIFQAVKRYEPRVTIDSISFSGDISGKIIPKVVITL